MRLVMALVGSVILMPIAAFCLFGFMATFEPSDQPGAFLAFRIGYAVIGLGSVAGVIGLVAVCFRRMPK